MASRAAGARVISIAAGCVLTAALAAAQTGAAWSPPRIQHLDLGGIGREEIVAQSVIVIFDDRIGAWHKDADRDRGAS